jgi:hypothetical protein
MFFCVNGDKSLSRFVLIFFQNEEKKRNLPLKKEEAGSEGR